MKKSLFISIIALCFVACNKNDVNIDNIISKDRILEMDKKEQRYLKNNEYKITKILNKQNLKTYNTTGEWSIIIDNNNFGLFVGCNRIFGSIEQNNNQLIFKNPASTKMMCLPDMMEVENLISINLTTLNIVSDGLENNNIKVFFK